MPWEQVADPLRAAFEPLARRFGLHRRCDTFRPRELTLTYENDRVFLRITIEPGADPSVVLGKNGGLLFGLHELGVVPSRSGDEAGHLAALADLTEKLGAPILTGDFSSFDRLRRERAVRVRENNRARWGTSTGETPRFRSRPDIGELFADASNDGIRTARVYQGLWDYDYSREELASHLGETTADIQRRLDAWDRLL